MLRTLCTVVFYVAPLLADVYAINWHKIPKNLDTERFAVTILKFEQSGLPYITVSKRY